MKNFWNVWVSLVVLICTAFPISASGCKQDSSNIDKLSGEFAFINNIDAPQDAQKLITSRFESIETLSNELATRTDTLVLIFDDQTVSTCDIKLAFSGLNPDLNVSLVGNKNSNYYQLSNKFNKQPNPELYAEMILALLFPELPPPPSEAILAFDGINNTTAVAYTQVEGTTTYGRTPDETEEEDYEYFIEQEREKEQEHYSEENDTPSEQKSNKQSKLEKEKQKAYDAYKAKERKIPQKPGPGESMTDFLKRRMNYIRDLINDIKAFDRKYAPGRHDSNKIQGFERAIINDEKRYTRERQREETKKGRCNNIKGRGIIKIVGKLWCESQ